MLGQSHSHQPTAKSQLGHCLSCLLGLFWVVVGYLCCPYHMLLGLFYILPCQDAQSQQSATLYIYICLVACYTVHQRHFLLCLHFYLLMGPAGVLSSSPMVCAPLMAQSVEQMIADMHSAKKQGADVAEVRLDHINNFQPRQDLETILRNKPLPVLIVCR